MPRSAPLPRLRIGSRRSALARRQAERVADLARSAWPALEVELVTLDTEGDRVLDRPLPEIGGKGLFTAELEQALLAGRIDLAVHSLKDLPTELPPGLELLCVPEREDPRDVLVRADAVEAGLEGLAPGSVVGTSSLRRKALLRRHRPDLEPRDIRGNVETRVEKCRTGGYDAVVLAAAGLRRLGHEASESVPLSPPEWLPAAGQGALAVEGRSEDPEVASLVVPLRDASAWASAAAERALLAALGGGCQLPLGALAEHEDGELRLRAVVLSPGGERAVRGERAGPAARAAELGRRLAEELLERGADELLAMVE